MTDAAVADTGPRPTLWMLVFAGPALRTSLLGCVLVAEKEIGRKFSLGAGALAVLVESIIFGGLLAVFLVSPLTAWVGLRRVSAAAAVLTVLCLAASLIAAPLMTSGGGASVILFVGAILIGFFAAVLSPTTQTLLNRATNSNGPSRRSLQSVWSAGQPAGFIIAALAGGILVERFGWWATLIVPLGFALVSALALIDGKIVHPSDHERPQDHPRPSEIVWIVLALLAFEIWATWGSLTSWLEPGVLAALIITVIVSTVAINRLCQSSCPCVPLTPFSIAGFAAAVLVIFVYQLPTTAEFEVLLLAELMHMSSADIGTRTAIGNASQIAGTALAAVLLLQHRVRLALVAGFVFTIVGLASYSLYFWCDGFTLAAVTRAIVGFGSGLLTPILFVIALDRMPPPLQVAAGTWLVLAIIGGTEVGLALFDIVLDLATALTGSSIGGYLSVEVGQLTVATATMILTILLYLRGSLPLTNRAAAASRRIQ